MRHAARQLPAWLIFDVRQKNFPSMASDSDIASRRARPLKKKLLAIAVLYQVIPVVLVLAWIMGDFFALFGVNPNDQSWRSYAATAGGWILMEVPLIAVLGIVAFLWSRKTPSKKLDLGSHN